MRAEQPICFATFRLDPVNERLWRGAELLALSPRPFTVLRYLAAHPGRLVTKEELLEVLWPRTRVSPGVLKAYVRMLRQVLGDDAAAPQFIETVPGRGYRFIGRVVRSQYPVVSSQNPEGSRQTRTTDNWQLPTPLVGRETELARLHGWLEKARNGERRVVFVTGEPGIGKTALVDAFLAQVAAQDDLWIGRGQCIDHYGTGEAYLPVFDALGRLCRVPGQGHFLDLLNRTT